MHFILFCKLQYNIQRGLSTNISMQRWNKHAYSFYIYSSLRRCTKNKKKFTALPYRFYFNQSLIDFILLFLLKNIVCCAFAYAFRFACLLMLLLCFSSKLHHNIAILLYTQYIPPLYSHTYTHNTYI